MKHNMGLFNKTIKKLSHPIDGLLFAFQTDLSFKMDIVVGVLLLIFGYVMNPLSETEILFLVLSWLLLLITELQNTSIETALDRIHPERHVEIGKSKDISSSSVLIALIFIVIVVLAILFNHF